MAIAEVNALVNLITQATTFAQQTALGWYKASQAVQLLPSKVAVLEQQANSWASLLNRYGMSDDLRIGNVLTEAIQLLRQEELKVKQLQRSCCLRTGRKLVFPPSLIGALDNVITAFQNLSETISEQATRTQQLEIISVHRVSRVPFLPDRKYVPFQVSIMAVRTALESDTTGPIVVLSGGPGQGKSSMARYIACLYQDGVAQSGHRCNEISIRPPKRFVDGVLFLHCGKNADRKGLLLQLWQDLGYQDLPTSDQGQASSINAGVDMPSTSAFENFIHKQLSARLANQRVLIILDDVWDPATVDRLLVQQQGIKYLITTQIAGLWTDAMCAEVPISRPTSQEANQILANHVKGFPEEVSSDLQDVINMIIHRSDYNPLVLANVATNISLGKASKLQEWKSTLKYLSDLQDGDGRRPVSLFGHTYSKRTMGVSIEMAFSSFSSEEQTLLFLASVCESQAVPEVVFKIFFKIIHFSLAKFSRCCEQLETNNFIQIETKIDPGLNVPQRSWSLHTMRQNFISLTKENEIVLIFNKLLEQIETDNMAALLLLLYGRESWRDQAARNVRDTSTLATSKLSSIRPFVWLLHADGEEEWEKQSHELAKQILDDYLLFGKFDQKKIIELLGMQETIPLVCQALLQFAVFTQEPLFKDKNQEILHNLVSCLRETDPICQPQLRARLHGVLHLLGQLSFYNVEDAMEIGSYSGVVERLVGLLGEGVSPGIQNLAAWTLGQLSKKVVSISTKIGSSPGVVERLVGLLGEERSPDIQKDAAGTLGELASNVVHNAIKIGLCPGVVERLVRLLADGIDPVIQKHAAWALGQLSKNVVNNAINIGLQAGAIERLVAILAERVQLNVREVAAWALGQLSKDVIGNALLIGSCSGVIQGLVQLLEKSMSVDVQAKATWTLGQLSKDVLGNAIQIGGCYVAMERLVGLLAEEASPPLQWNAVATLWFISCGVFKNRRLLRTALLNAPIAMKALAVLTSREKHGDGSLQYWGAKVYELANIDKGERALTYKSSRAYVGKGDAKVTLEDYKGALEAYENGVAISSDDDDDIISQRCFVKAKLGDLEGALIDAENYVKITNDKPFALQERGVVKRMMGDLQGALTDLNEALNSHEDDYEIRKQQGFVKFLLNDEDGARAAAEWALKVKHPSVDTYSYKWTPDLGRDSVEYLGYKLK